MAGEKQKYDMSSPGALAEANAIRREPFVKEGMMVAFPTCFPGATLAIPSDESHITALDIAGDGIVHGGTSGRTTHLIAGAFHGVSGVVFDMGAVEAADHCPAVCCGKTKLVACVNGAGGGRIIISRLQPPPDDLLQEWDIGRKAFQDLGEAVKGEPILHAVADQTGEHVVGITPQHLFRVNVEDTTITVAGEITGSGRVGLGSRGGVFGRDGSTHLWRYDPRSQTIERHAVKLPSGDWSATDLRWTRDSTSGLLYTADGEGNLFSFDERKGFGGPLGRTSPAPVGPMAVTLDGRVFGFCGNEISRMFCYDPRGRTVRDVAVAVSVIERRRYGYTFGDAVTGRDGQIFFGEDDDLGHLWLYFPRIQGV